MKRWIESICYTSKHEKPTDENILRLLVPSFVGILVCMVCLAGSTWAWFSASLSTPPQTIAAANFHMEVTVDGQSVESSMDLTAGQSYAVKLTTTGTAEKFGGYCVIAGGGVTRYTEQVLPGKTLTFTFTPAKTASYTFTAVWGRYQGTADITQEQSPKPAGPPAEETNTAAGVYVVQAGDVLWEIAKAYGTTIEELTAYNGLDDPSKLQIGQEIKIPEPGLE